MCDYKKIILKRNHDSGTETVYYPLAYEGLPDEFKRKAEEELNETDENLKYGLQRLKDFAKTQNTAAPEEFILLSVLRSCKYNMKKSEAKLKQFLKKRREFIKVLAKIDQHKIENILDDSGVGILPYRDKHGRPIFFTRPYGMNLEKYDFSDVAVVGIAQILMLMKYPITSVSGYAYFGDCDMPSYYLFYPIAKQFKKWITSVLSFPLRLSKIEILNENYLFHYFYKLLSPFISKKILSRISLNGDGYKNLQKTYDPDTLPKEFGGNMGPLSSESYRQKFLDFVAELKKESLS